MIGKSLAHYRVTGALGAGGMGEVYRASDSRLSREVAIKVLPAEVAEDPELLARFKREDGREIAYQALDGTVMAAAVSAAGTS